MHPQLTNNAATGRIELDGYEFHAGDALEVLIVSESGIPEWTPTRIEYSHKRGEWYLIGLDSLRIAGLFARLP